MSETWVAGGKSPSCLTLDEANGSVPVKAMAEVLETVWAKEQGWTTVEAGRVYQRPLEHAVTLTIRINDMGQVEATRALEGERVREGVDAATIREKHRLALVATQEQAQLALGELVGHTMARSLEIAAAEMNLTQVAAPVISVQGYQMHYELNLQIELPS
jgi:hypothetical protein